MPLVLDKPIQLEPIFRERVWGRTTLAPFFSATPGNQLIGEVWFTFEENGTALGKSLGQLLSESPGILGNAADPHHPGLCPLLAKLIFTSERLSVQVHPDDDYAERHHGSLGKTEAWYVLAAEPPGEVAVGFRQSLDRNGLQAAARSGEIENLLEWRKVKPGDLIFVPAGTVHAIGAGLTVCEIQENSDITYRLYDYGRPRELHLEHGSRVADLSPMAHTPTRRALASWREELVSCKYFRIERLRAKALRIDAGLEYYVLLMCIEGAGTIAGQPFAPGQTWLVPAQNDALEIEGRESEWILAYTAEAALARIAAVQTR